jgi:hypothetical protein
MNVLIQILVSFAAHYTLLFRTFLLTGTYVILILLFIHILSPCLLFHVIKIKTTLSFLGLDYPFFNFIELTTNEEFETVEASNNSPLLIIVMNISEGKFGYFATM